jgi:aromatic-L-amino-acid decarboxylase
MVEQAEEWELMAPVPLQTVCIRHVPAMMRDDEAALTEHNLRIARHVNEAGMAYLTPSLLKGRQMIRVSIGAEATERRHVEALWEALQVAGAG